MDKLLELTVIPQVISSNLPLHLLNNPKNAPQHLLKMLSSDKYLRILLCRIHRPTKKPVSFLNRRHHHLFTLTPSMLTRPLSPYQRSKIWYLNLPRYLFLSHSTPPRLRSPQSPSSWLPSRSLPPAASHPLKSLPKAHQPLSSSLEKTQSTKSCMLNTTMHSWR